MNLPNKLTLGRALISPVFMALLLYDNVYSRYAALAVFLLASLSDILDGYLARRNGQQTGFGKIMDPIADKLLISVALVAFVALKLSSVWMVMVIIVREFLIMGLRTLVAYRGQIMESSILAKLKTSSQMLAVLAVLVFLCCRDTLAASGSYLPEYQLANYIFILDGLIFLAMLLTVVSGLDYLIKSRWLILGLFKGNM
ncbi:CDP-diacylglycerol--glycerol-3-phosphate 3-phosphatidyltransferase [candidate division TA06 bacterium]|uniref:CDP-diacylglycerol--glycerol-3-phosphate 3-phosphatidyltransferase n=1 Tax=candidate division TA06 bacterium TaxID=2250710 RepID=A0A933I8D8_UNCT6|nr:CDP-diacylglycerol--glycerol-3-phosphate 3-phosphatidyltransferase [candidate division TA06 bacterium]